MNGFKEFWNNYKGAIIGVVIAALILITRLQDLIVAIVVLVLGALIGNYVQQNKDDVKIKLKNFIRRERNIMMKKNYSLLSLLYAYIIKITILFYI